MDPTVGRFAGMDPWEGNAYDPPSFHSYRYASADPVNKLDPSGRFTTIQLVGVGAIIGILASQAYLVTSGARHSVEEQLLITFAGAALGAALGALYAGVTVVAAAGAGAAGTGAAALPQVGAKFDWSRAQHIFRAAQGHVNPIFQATKERFVQLFEAVASNPQNFRPDYPLPVAAREAGVRAFAQVFHNGQVWVYVLNGKVVNAGVNQPGLYR